MKSIHTEIEILAPSEKVWEILTDFEKYGEWNPFIKSMEGEPKKGAKLKARIHPPGGNAMTFKPTCLESKVRSEFRWLGHLLVPGLFDGEHIFRMREISPGVTKFVQMENFKGLLLPLFWKNISPKTLQGFDDMNRALKKRAEES